MGLKLIEILPELAKAQADAVANIDINSLILYLVMVAQQMEIVEAGNQIAGIVTGYNKSYPSF